LYGLGLNADESIFDFLYKPLPLYWIERLMKYSIKLYEHLVDEKEFVVSCSILENNEIVFWDIATPKGKIETFIGEKNTNGGASLFNRRIYQYYLLTKEIAYVKRY